MDNATKKYLATAVTGMAAIYDKEIPVSAIAMWAEMLDGYGVEQLREAFNLHGRESKWMPKPSDIIDRLEGRDEGSKAQLEGAAHLAARRILDSVGGVGVYRSVVVDDPVAHEALRLTGGWQALCNLPESEEKWWVKDFVAHYARAAVRDLPDPEPLAGLHDGKPVQIQTGTFAGKMLSDGQRKLK